MFAVAFYLLLILDDMYYLVIDFVLDPIVQASSYHGLILSGFCSVC